MNEVFELDSFTDSLAELEPVEREWIEKMKNQFRNNLDVGKSIRGDWLFEKKLGSKRLYFAVNKITRKALLLLFAHKKDQHKAIFELSQDKLVYLALIR